MNICDYCGREFARKNWEVSFKGKTYYFCTKECSTSFCFDFDNAWVNQDFNTRLARGLFGGSR